MLHDEFYCEKCKEEVAVTLTIGDDMVPASSALPSRSDPSRPAAGRGSPRPARRNV